MSEIQRDSISAPEESLLIFNVTSNCIETWIQGWQKIWCYDSSSCKCCYSFVDSRDSNIYHYTHIGDQIWMCENLKYLPAVVGPATGSMTMPYYYVYGYNGTDVDSAKATSNYNTYGVLYNWPAAMAGSASSVVNPSGVQGVCPSGWHLPSDAEWTQMENYLANNGYNYDGSIGGGGSKIAKALASTTGWNASTGIGTPGNTDYPEYRNKSGFSALPGGQRNNNGSSFDSIGTSGFWWTSSEMYVNYGLYRYLHIYSTSIDRHNLTSLVGLSVRCVRD